MAFYIYYYYGVGTTLPLTTACILNTYVRSTITYDTSVCTPYILLYFVIQQNIVLMQHVGLVLIQHVGTCCLLLKMDIVRPVRPTE